MPDLKNLDQTEESLSWKNFWVELWRLLGSFHRQVFLLLGIATFTAGLDLVQPYILKFVVDGLTNFSQAVISVAGCTP